MSAPLDRSATWAYDATGEPGQYSYARAEQPNAVAVEAELSALEGGRSLLFPAGMAVWLVNADGKYLHESLQGFTGELKFAWCGQRQHFEAVKAQMPKVVARLMFEVVP